MAEIAVVVRQTDGDRRGISSSCKNRISALGRLPPKDYGDKAEYSSSTDSKSPKNQEEIISIIRRIRSSIEKESAKLQERSSNSKSSDENASSLESVLEVLSQSRTPGDAFFFFFILYFLMKFSSLLTEKTARKEGKKTTMQKRRRDSLRKEPKTELSSSSPPPLLSTRPTSNFVRKSPIPSLVQESVDLKNRVDFKRTAAEAAVQELEKMKLSQLKEIAKCNGIKGYSRMKKAELIKLLSNTSNKL